MKVAVGIDPGLRACGVAIADVQTSAIQRAWLVRNPEREDDAAAAWEAMARAIAAELDAAMQAIANEHGSASVEVLAVERQAIRGDPRRGLITRNPGQIIGLAHVVGAIVPLIPARVKVAVWPQSWNGNLKKEKSTATVLRSLSAEEMQRVEGAHLSTTGHNVIDSAGIAKWAARRARVQLSAG